MENQELCSSKIFFVNLTMIDLTLTYSQSYLKIKEHICWKFHID